MIRKVFTVSRYDALLERGRRRGREETLKLNDARFGHDDVANATQPVSFRDRADKTNLAAAPPPRDAGLLLIRRRQSPLSLPVYLSTRDATETPSDPRLFLPSCLPLERPTRSTLQTNEKSTQSAFSRQHKHPCINNK